MKMHITITNNETGEKLLDTDTNAIIGAVANEDGVSQIVYTQCEAIVLAQTTLYAETAAKSVYEEDEKIKALIELGKIIEAKNQEENEEKGE